MQIEPQPSELIFQGSSFQVEFRRDGNRLRALVTGVSGTLARAHEYWLAIAQEAGRVGVSMLLVVDRTTGDKLRPEELEQFIHDLDGLGLDSLRIAYVGTEASRAAQHEATEILAREQGFVVRVFGIEAEASLWLRHGEN